VQRAGRSAKERDMNRNGFDPKRKPRARTSADWNNQIDAADGHREQLLGALRECYGISSSEAEHQFRQCVYDTEAAFEAETDPLSRLRRVLAH
jgi:hypothetical protein